MEEENKKRVFTNTLINKKIALKNLKPPTKKISL